jgi:hypothetical protein
MIASKIPKRDTEWERQQRIEQQKEGVPDFSTFIKFFLDLRQKDRDYKRTLEEMINAMDANRVLLFERVSTSAEKRKEQQRIEQLLSRSGLSLDLARRKPKDYSMEARSLAKVYYEDEEESEEESFYSEDEDEEDEEEEEESEDEAQDTY